MDDETRLAIEERIDELLHSLSREDSVKNIVDWIMDNLVGVSEKTFRQEIKSAENIAVGYVAGYLASVCHQIIMQKKRPQKFDSVRSKIKNDKLSELEKTSKEIIVKVNVTNKEAKIVRELIQSKIPIIREEVIKALNA